MRVLLPTLLFLLTMACFACTFVGQFGAFAQWSDILYVIKDSGIGEDVRKDIESIVLRSQTYWIIARWLSGSAAVVALFLVGAGLVSRR